MAIFHMRAQIISRAAGRSAIAAAAYRAGERLRDERTGQMHDYSRKAYVEHREIMVPEAAPAWMLDRAALWSGVEAAEKRKDAQLAREVHFALPRELDRAERVELIRDFCQREFVARGMIADVAIHNPSGRDGGEQPHAHVMLTTRVLTGEGFGAKDREWNDKALYEGWRAGWAEHANRALERVGSRERIDHRSFAERGIDREPEPKLGPKAARLERAETRAAANENRPVAPVTERGAEWENVRARNRVRDQVRGQLELGLRELQEVAERVFGQAREQLEAVWQRMERAVAVVWERFVGGRVDGAADSGARADGVPVPERIPAEPFRAEPSRDKLLGRDATARDDRDHSTVTGEASGRDTGQPGKPGSAALGQTERDALLGKAPLPTPTRLIPTPADLLGRKPLQNTPQPPGRDKDGGRER
ncbi:MAG: MobA/MobL family protein [Acidocella sp.]|nr:MobA/MobL family protein [Acidocella sp.]